MISPTPWIFAFTRFFAVSDLDTLGVGALLVHPLLEVPVTCCFTRVVLVVSRVQCLWIFPIQFHHCTLKNFIVYLSMPCTYLGPLTLYHRVTNIFVVRLRLFWYSVGLFSIVGWSFWDHHIPGLVLRFCACVWVITSTLPSSDILVLRDCPDLGFPFI